MDIFEQASRQKLRFPSTKGELTTEQLWDLPLLVTGNARGTGFDLDTIARGINADLKAITEDSFVVTRPDPRKAVLTLKLDILKHVIAAKIDENEARKASAEKAEKRRKLLDALAAKEDAELGSKSKEDILKELAALDA